MRPARIEVSDTGIGIPSSRLEEIFSPFHQVDSSSARSFGGTGLGLTISRSLCELMGFELYALSREGEGSTFVIDLESKRPTRVGPVSDAGAAPAVSAESSG
jgi:signal transduction histidine kinase